jgi:hypothetical protein
MLRPLDTKELHERFVSAKPFPFVCIDDFLDPDLARRIAASYPDFEAAKALGHVFNAANERRKLQITDELSFPDPVKALATVLGSEDFRKTLSEISGIDDLLWDPAYVGAGMHMTAASGRLDVHIDFNRLENGWHRRLNLLFFLNEDWQDDWGGRLELWNADVSECVHSFQPLFNRMVLFETSQISYHGVTPIKCPPDVVRRSFALYYYSEGVPAGVHADHTHSTVFKARPDEFLRGRVLVPLLTAGQMVKNKYRNALVRAERLLGWRRA